LISSQGYKKHINPFADYNLKLVQGISSPPVYFLQHGVGKYDMRSWLRKYDINFSLILTVSDYDWEAFVRTYNYDEKIIQELGFPRYDNLTNENLKKEIVIIPTWRKDIISEEALLSSEYFKRWNNLLNDKKVIDFANEKGYDIVFKPHPNSMRFLDSFDTENVTVDTERKFHDVLCESSLMITDYSSVNFDFAYLKKPVIYYQYGNDYHFEGDALIDDEVSTFGDIIDDENILSEKIIEYIDNDCKMEDKYISRVLKFFKFNDKNNSKRVYDWILKH
ncbi:CDP-glycerol glycerophosphotransferase family protein, partial [uncultured Methanobrevibacter sp.]|uniref:CDP-glycerol glycerophosphotransferase family protein n=1 Tax=uncultured Methanobrevibacter sp. TaxID=253161 RepID=UPI0025E3EDCC